MSRRYGRNQKRKARQEIEKLTRQVGYWIEAYDADVLTARRDATRLRIALERVAYALGPNFVGLKPEQIARRTETLDSDYGFMAPDPRDGNGPMQPVKMHALEYRSFQDNTDPRRRMHFDVVLASGRIGYAVSEEAIAYTPHVLLAETIASKIAHNIVQSIKARHPSPTHHGAEP